MSINSAILIDINKDQLAAFARGETKPLEMAANQVDLVYRVQLVALSEEKSKEHFHGISDLSTEKVKGTLDIHHFPIMLQALCYLALRSVGHSRNTLSTGIENDLNEQVDSFFLLKLLPINTIERIPCSFSLSILKN